MKLEILMVQIGSIEVLDDDAVKTAGCELYNGVVSQVEDVEVCH